MPDEKAVHSFMEFPDKIIESVPDYNEAPHNLRVLDINNDTIFEQDGYCPVELYKGNLVKGCKNYNLTLKDKKYCFDGVKNYKIFRKHPYVFNCIKLPHKLPIHKNPSSTKDTLKHGDMMAYLENYLSKILTSLLNQLALCRIKYPKISLKETTLKLLSMSLKASNPNKQDNFKMKYNTKMKLFMRHCMISALQIKEADRRSIFFQVLIKFSCGVGLTFGGKRLDRG